MELVINDKELNPELGLVIQNNLDLRMTNITKLPENLTINGYLDLQGTPIFELPKNLTVNGYLDLRGTKITTLPENLTINGYLDLRGLKITKLPKSLTVNDNLYLAGTQITELPKDLNVTDISGLERTNIIDYPVVYNCGKSYRAIYLDFKDRTLIHIGCFKGTKEEAIQRISQEYSGEAMNSYISKVNECFELESSFNQHQK